MSYSGNQLNDLLVSYDGTACILAKNLPDQRLAIASGSVARIKSVHNDINLPISVLTAASASNEPDNRPADIAAFTCLEHDLMYRGDTGTIRRGDILLFSNVGACSLVTPPPFIRTAPPHVVPMWAESGEWLC